MCCAILNRTEESLRVYLIDMAAIRTLLCIHRNPAQLSLLQERGYELVTATNGSDGLRMFMSMSRPVDAVVLEHSLGLLEGSGIADEIKRVQPKVPIVMLVDHMEFPEGALQSVDALVVKSDGVHFLWATVHFVLNVRPEQHRKKGRAQTPAHPRRPGRLREVAHSDQGPSSIDSFLASLTIDEREAPFSRKVWQALLNGTVQF